MTPAIQPALDGTLPAPATLSYPEWADHVRPAFVAAARSGRRFTSYEIAVENDLPEPANAKADWGNFVQSLAREGLIEDAGTDRSARRTSERSRVAVWRGTRAAQAGRVA
ncbi:hypothetical protein ABZX40_13275 [Streptomyces sp. NPDC004610]|uniref:hypothetical protein n=1 Tax=unclassified Streptomyces TaxID=2593676 RepID=UPI0033BDDA06